MRAIIILISVLLGVSVCSARDKDLLLVRNLYYKASSNKDDATRFNDYLASSPDINQALLKGYQGMSWMIRANYSWNPYNKLSYFTKGKDLLEEAIEKDPANVELRFLRFCVQTNAPGFLGYSGKISDDREVIVKGYTDLKDKDLRDRIKNYLVTSKYCSSSDKSVLK